MFPSLRDCILTGDMLWTILPYLLPILLAAAIGGGVSYVAWRKRPVPGAGPMCILALAIVVWSIFYALELGSSTLEAKVFWCKIQYLGIVSAPVAWFFLALEYTGREDWVRRRNLALLSLIPLSTIGLLWLQPTLVWSHNDVAVAGPVSFFAPAHGPWFWVQIGYTYLLLASGSVMMVVGALRSPNLYRWQARAFLASIALPWATNGFYISGLTPLDLTPFGFALSTAMVAAAIFRVQLFDVMPVARTAIVESMSDPVIVLDGQDRIVDANPASRLLTGWPPSNLVGQSITEVLQPVAALVSGCDEMDPRHQEIALGTGDGQRFYFVRLSTVRDRQDRVRGKLLLFHDVTARRRAEEDARREKAFSEAIVSALPGVFYVVDEQGHLRRWNENLEGVTGYSSSELAHIDPVTLVAGANRQLVQDRLRAAFSSGEIAAEITFASKDGRETPYLFTGRRVELGNRAHLVGMGLDISERKQREREMECFVTVSRALRAANHRRQMLPVILDEAMRLLKAGGAMIVTHGQADCKRVELAHGGWRALSGQDLASDAMFQTFYDADAGPYFRADDVRNLSQCPYPALLAPFFAVVGAPLMQDDDVIGVIWIGRRRPFSPDEGHSLTAIAEIAASALSRADILETVEQRVRERTRALNAANERLRDMDRLKSKLIDDVSHELRTPVTTMGLYLRLLERGKASEQPRYLSVLHEQSDRLNRVVESVLHFSRLEAIAAGTAPQAVNLNAAVDEALGVFRSQAAEIGLQIQTYLMPSLPSASGIRPMLLRALSHLLDNALKYTPEGTITVATDYDAQRKSVGFQVCDSGIGISSEDLPHVFERFYRGQRVSQLTTPGTGLGLALVQHIAALHHGRVEIESEENRGTTVRLWLPMHMEHPPARSFADQPLAHEKLLQTL